MTAFDKPLTLSQGSLPIFPLFHHVNRYSEEILHGQIRLSRDSTFWVSAGINVRSVPDFCGGLFCSSANVMVNRFDRTWAQEEQLAQWDAMPTMDGLFPGVYWRAAYAEVPPLNPDYLHASPNAARQAVALLQVVGGISLAAALFRLAASYNRTSLTFWDKRQGFTRRFLKWAYLTLGGGVCVPDRYPADYAPDRRTEWGPSVFADHTWTVWYPRRYSTGLYIRNLNSGADVATGVMSYATVKASAFVPNPRQKAFHVSWAMPQAVTGDFVRRMYGSESFMRPDRLFPM